MGLMAPGDRSSASEQPPEGTLDYARNAYDLALNWFRIAETKAQLILTADGLFLSLLFGVALGKSSDLPSLTNQFGPETWVLLLVAAGALCGSICCAATSLWSMHSRRITNDFRRLNLDPAKPETYRPEGLWYFAELAQLPIEDATRALSRYGSEAEATALRYNTVMLSRNVLRKHNLLNAGRAASALTLTASTVMATDILLRAS